MKATTEQVQDAMHFLNAIRILFDLKDMKYVYANNLDLLWRCLEAIEIDDTIDENEQ
jgi:RNAse (barnase) inhibitor barstar